MIGESKVLVGQFRGSSSILHPGKVRFRGRSSPSRRFGIFWDSILIAMFFARPLFLWQGGFPDGPSL
jgi:hypothetical protein